MWSFLNWVNTIETEATPWWLGIRKLLNESVFKEMRISILLTLILALASGTWPEDVTNASDCLTRPTVTEAFQTSKVVFAGKVTARFKYGAKFRVYQQWKGVSHRYVYIYTSNLRNDLEPWFEVGQSWLVYASDVPLYRTENSKVPYTKRLMVLPCGRTILLKFAEEDLKQLAKAQ
jgi:hypothetical protein